MNKLLLIISSALLISACTGEPQKQDPDALPNGIMQPVEGTGAVAGGSFMPEIEKNSMPNQNKFNVKGRINEKIVFIAPCEYRYFNGV